MRILLAGPLPATTASLASALKAASAIVLCCAPEDAVASVRIDEPDVVLLDPTHGASWRAATAIRRAGHSVGLVLLADADPAIEMVEAWLEQADDCLLGLLSPREVIAHCRAVDRRRRGHATARLGIREVAIDPNTGDVLVGDRVVQIPPKPRSLLAALLRNAGTVMSCDRLTAAVYGGDDWSDTKIIGVWICLLRKILTRAGAPAGFIETVWGEGYVIRREPRSADTLFWMRGVFNARRDARAARAAGEVA